MLRTLKFRLCIWILIICTLFGIAAGMWISRSEEHQATEEVKEALNLIGARYAADFENAVETKINVAIQANHIIANTLITNNLLSVDSTFLLDQDGAYRSTDGTTGAFLASTTKLTPHIKQYIHQSELDWNMVAPLVMVEFFNYYLITKDNFIRINPPDWALEIEHDHDFSTDLFYSVADPEQNPERQPKWTPVYYDSIWKKWMTSLIIPLYNKEEFLGITGSDFILDNIFDRIRGMLEVEGWCLAFIFDEKGDIVVHPDYMDQILQKQASMNSRLGTDSFVDQGIRSYIQSVIANQDSGEFYVGGKHYYASTHQIPALGWNLVLYADHDSVTAGVKELRTKVWLSTLSLALILTVVLIWVFNRLVLSRIDTLAHAAKEIKHKNWEPKLPKATDDEVGNLVSAFWEMKQEIKRLVAGLNDRIHEREKAEDEARIAKEEAERANYLKSEFLANISHELRTPMHAIMGFTRVAIKKMPVWTKQQQIENLLEVEDSGERLLDLLNDLLDISKLEAGIVEFTFRKHNVIDIANSAIRALQPLSIKKSLTISLEDTEEEVIAECDQEKIYQVILNFLSNAIKFSPDNTTVLITINNEIYKGKQSLLLKVIDQGIGIPEHELESVFDKFIQSSQTKTGAGGTGLGLSISKEIIEHHNGMIWAEQNNEGGAIMVFRIPKYQDQQEVLKKAA